MQAKNSLANVHGFSPAQLTFGQNPQLPNVLTDKPPALEEKEVSEIVRENLEAMRAARQAFIKAESNEKIKRALRHNIRPSAKNIFLQGDIVFYKRSDSREWRGPGKVIGSESSTILIKHGSQYVRVHVCRVLPVKGTYYDNKGDAKHATLEVNQNMNNKLQGVDEESEDESQPEKYPENLEKEDSESQEEEGSEHQQEEKEEIHEGKEYLAEEEVEQHQEDAEKSLHEDAARTQEDSENIGKWKKREKVGIETVDGVRHKGEIVRRTGKVTGKYKDFWVIKDEASGNLQEYDTKNDWKWWNKSAKRTETEEYIVTNEILFADESVQNSKEEKVKEAKELELKKWIEEEVYDVVEDSGQECLSTTWVITEKIVDGDQIIKARLVIRGYEENEKARSDSPTCGKDNIRLLLALAVSRDWKVHSLDVKAAFLQGKVIERDVYITAPKERRQNGQLWKLKKVVYGLSDASRSWYLRVAEAMEELKMRKLSLDNAVFLWEDLGAVQGVVVVHVDDMLFFGSQKFHSRVMAKFKTMFKISREEEKSFKYLGVNMTQDNEGVTMEQEAYVDALTEGLVDKTRLEDKERTATDEEKKAFRRGVGQLGWLQSTTRPEIGFAFCQLSTVQSKPKMRDFLKYKKAVKDLKCHRSSLRINKLDLKTAEVKAFSDASFGNLDCGGSQIGFLVFLCDRNGVAVPISWGSKKAKRVARSTLTAETIAANEAVDSAQVVKSVVEEVLGGHIPPVKLYVDNKSMFDAIGTTNFLTEKRLRIDMAALRELVEQRELIVQWVTAKQQLADVLTKQGASKEKLLAVLSSGRF